MLPPIASLLPLLRELPISNADIPNPNNGIPFPNPLRPLAPAVIPLVPPLPLGILDKRPFPLETIPFPVVLALLPFLSSQFLDL